MNPVAQRSPQVEEIRGGGGGGGAAEAKRETGYYVIGQCNASIHAIDTVSHSSVDKTTVIES